MRIRAGNPGYESAIAKRDQRKFEDYQVPSDYACSWICLNSANAFSKATRFESASGSCTNRK